MNTRKHIDSSIGELKLMLGDSNNELTSGQQSKLKKGIKDLKRLRHATNLTHAEVFAVVAEIAAVVIEIMMAGSSE